MDGMGIAKKVKRFMMQFLNKRNQKHLNEIVWMVFVLVVKVVVTTGYNLKKRIKVMNMMLHHLARLEMMKAEEKGIDLSYEGALNIVNK